MTTTATNATIRDLERKRDLTYSILNDVFPADKPINIMTEEVRDKVNYLFGDINEIERQIAAEREALELALRPFWKKLITKK